jgi:hypothetical protein
VATQSALPDLAHSCATTLKAVGEAPGMEDRSLAEATLAVQIELVMADLDAACVYLQDIADIEDGGIAALAISDVNFDWSAANRGERESASAHG